MQSNARKIGRRRVDGNCLGPRTPRMRVTRVMSMDFTVDDDF